MEASTAGDSQRTRPLIPYGKVIVVILLLMCFRIVGCVVSRPMIFHPLPETRNPAVPLVEPIEVSSGFRTAYGFLSARGNRLVVLFHGNHGNAYEFGWLATRLHQQGFSTLLVEYPGYGHASEYNTSEKAIVHDAMTLIQHVQSEYNFNSNETTVLGYSLGSGVAMAMLEKQLAGRGVLIAAYTSIPDVAELAWLPLLPELLIYDRFNSLGKAPAITVPVLLLHGEEDEMIPLAMGEQLDGALANSRLISIPAAAHNDVFHGMRPGEWQAIFDFIRAR